MRFRSGSKVEVFGTKEVPSGSWYSAEIIHGNGHYYTVKCTGDVGATSEGIFDRVPRKAIRPCPPVMQVLGDWTSGDVVEVFHCFSWKMATVVRVLHSARLLVRLIGYSGELEVRKVDVRPRLCWQNDEWKVIGKVSSSCEEGQDVPSKLTCKNSSRGMESAASLCFKVSYFPSSGLNNIQESLPIPSRSLKRKSVNHNPQIGPRSKKVRIIEEGCRRNHFISSRKLRLPRKVDGAASSRAAVVDKYLPLPDAKLVGRFKSKRKGGRADGAVLLSHARSSEIRCADSITSSVASCSISTVDLCRTPQGRGPSTFEENDVYNSDAESFCGLGSGEGNSLLPADEMLSEEIHRIELDAYRSTIEALHASGPLSWEQETLLTNLRDSLHITNDEHLMEGHSWRLICVASNVLR